MKYVGTISMEKWNEDGIKAVFKSLDGRELFAGREVGRSGFRHYQFAIDCGGDLLEYTNNNSTGWHVEPCISWDDAVNYCRKTGNYLYIGDSIEEREYQRIKGRGYLPIWHNIVQSLVKQNDRQITVWIDRKGGHGKSTLCYLMCRRGKAILVPRIEQNPIRMGDFICMHYDNERLIIVDLPRQEEVTPELCCVLEDLKDGTLSTGKYQGTKKFIRGARVLVLTNNWVPHEAYESLSRDRWDIHQIADDGTEKIPESARNEG